MARRPAAKGAKRRASSAERPGRAGPGGRRKVVGTFGRAGAASRQHSKPHERPAAAGPARGRLGGLAGFPHGPPVVRSEHPLPARPGSRPAPLPVAAEPYIRCPPALGAAAAAMLSRSRCVSRAFSRSLSAFQKGNCPLGRRSLPALTAVASSAFASSELQLCADDVVTVKTPAFAESVTEGDVRWEKGSSTSKWRD
uniref:Dihydrolipoamide S-succinyltransferase n=1 Tax=Equus asinus TaxID=9793 RepID=A0A9L0ISM9_EQUAS